MSVLNFVLSSVIIKVIITSKKKKFIIKDVY